MALARHRDDRGTGAGATKRVGQPVRLRLAVGAPFDRQDQSKKRARLGAAGWGQRGWRIDTGVGLQNDSEPIFPRVEESQHEDVGSRQLIAEQVIRDAEFPNLSRFVLAQPNASARKVEQIFWCLFKRLLDLGSQPWVMCGDKVGKAVDIIARLERPPYDHAARAAFDRALRLAAKCFSTSS